MIISNSIIVKESNNDTDLLDNVATIVSMYCQENGEIWAGQIIIDDDYNDRFFKLPDCLSGQNSPKLVPLLRDKGINIEFKAIGRDESLILFDPIEHNLFLHFSSEELVTLADEIFNLDDTIKRKAEELSLYVKSKRLEIATMKAHNEEKKAQHKNKGMDKEYMAIRSIDFNEKIIHYIDSKTSEVIETKPLDLANLMSLRYEKKHRTQQLIITD